MRFNLTTSLLVLIVWAFTSAINAQPTTFTKDTSYTLHSAYQKYVKLYPKIEPITLSPSESVIVNYEIPYSDLGYRNLNLDIFSPALKAEEPYPAILMIHGGGWISGDKSLLHPLAQQLANAGYVAITAEYRLSPEAQYPAAVIDLRTALNWIGKHAVDYHINPENVIVLGSSAGGQLAALVATTLNTEFHTPVNSSVSITALINLDGVLAFIHPVSEEGRVAGLWLGGDQQEARNIWLEASALTHVSEHTPPTLFVGSKYPRFLAGRTEMVSLLDSYSIPHQTFILEDAPHSFWLFDPWFEPTTEHILTFLEKYTPGR